MSINERCDEQEYSERDGEQTNASSNLNPLSKNKDIDVAQAMKLQDFSQVPALPIDPQELINKLEEMVKFALECEKRDLNDNFPFVEVFQQLQELQKSMDLLTEYQKESMLLLSDMAAREGISLSDTQDELSDEDKKIIDKLKALSHLCEAAKERVHESIIQNPDVQQAVTEKIKDASATEDKKQIRRKNKFRSMGGKQGWMPM